jgi:glycosyltransferase involved in cell wall biosynthesis
MRISVAMATWNGQRFLAEQLESIAHQVRLPDELVLSDDASSDATVAIAERFARRAPFNVVILRNDKRIGHADNFFRSMARCSGDVIALCDQDDVWHPHKLARCERPLRLDSGISLVAHSARVVNEYLEPSRYAWPGYIRKQRVLPAGSFPPFTCDRFAGFTLMFRSIFVRAADVAKRPPPPDGVSSSGARITHDIWAQLVCGALGAVALIPDELALYRRHGTNTGQGAVSRPSVIQSSLALRMEHVTYRARCNSIRERWAYLESLRPLAAELGESATAGLERAVECHDRYARAMEHRVAVYAERRGRARALGVARNTLRGDYKPRSRGGLGLLSLARDVTIGVGRSLRKDGDGRVERP